MVIRVRVAIRPVRLFGINLHDRKQWQAEITHVPQQAMQRGLIDERASKDGCSVACLGEAQARKLVGPSVIKVSLKANLIPSRLVAERLMPASATSTRLSRPALPMRLIYLGLRVKIRSRMASEHPEGEPSHRGAK
jgi:hypothetical protein